MARAVHDPGGGGWQRVGARHAARKSRKRRANAARRRHVLPPPRCHPLPLLPNPIALRQAMRSADAQAKPAPASATTQRSSTSYRDAAAAPQRRPVQTPSSRPSQPGGLPKRGLDPTRADDREPSPPSTPPPGPARRPRARRAARGRPIPATHDVRGVEVVGLEAKLDALKRLVVTLGAEIEALRRQHVPGPTPSPTSAPPPTPPAAAPCVRRQSSGVPRPPFHPPPLPPWLPPARRPGLSSFHSSSVTFNDESAVTRLPPPSKNSSTPPGVPLPPPSASLRTSTISQQKAVSSDEATKPSTPSSPYPPPPPSTPHPDGDVVRDVDYPIFHPSAFPGAPPAFWRPPTRFPIDLKPYPDSKSFRRQFPCEHVQRADRAEAPAALRRLELYMCMFTGVADGVETFTGDTIVLNVKGDATIDDLESKLMAVAGAPPLPRLLEYSYFSYGDWESDRELDKTMTVTELGLVSGDVMWCTLDYMVPHGFPLHHTSARGFLPSRDRLPDCACRRCGPCSAPELGVSASTPPATPPSSPPASPAALQPSGAPPRPSAAPATSHHSDSSLSTEPAPSSPSTSPPSPPPPPSPPRTRSVTARRRRSPRM